MNFLFLVSVAKSALFHDPDQEDGESLKKSQFVSLVNSIPTSRGPIDMSAYILARSKAIGAGVFGL